MGRDKQVKISEKVILIRNDIKHSQMEKRSFCEHSANSDVGPLSTR